MSIAIKTKSCLQKEVKCINGICKESFSSSVNIICSYTYNYYYPIFIIMTIIKS